MFLEQNRWCNPTGFPKKDARFLKLKNDPDLIRDDREVKIVENIEYLNIWAIGNPVYEGCLTNTNIPGILCLSALYLK